MTSLRLWSGGRLAAGHEPRPWAASEAAGKTQRARPKMGLGGRRRNGNVPFSNGHASHASVCPTMPLGMRQRNQLGGETSEGRHVWRDPQYGVPKARKPEDG